jgi:hypothetical protein
MPSVYYYSSKLSWLYLGTVQDPLTKDFETLEREDRDRRSLARLEEHMDELESGPEGLPDEDEDTDEELPF